MQTKKEFEIFFKSAILPGAKERFERDGRIDYSARREKWNNAIDILIKEGDLPYYAYQRECPW